ncbi:MAG: cytochrome b/b6 domain-containing protein [Planctomycetota bacterium]
MRTGCKRLTNGPSTRTPGLTAAFSVSGRLMVMILLLAWSPRPACADDPDNCLLCHQYRGLGRYVPAEGVFHLYFTSPDYQHRRLGAHARIACTDCHKRSEVSVIPHKPTSPVDCTQQCHLRNVNGIARRFSHANVAEMLDQSIHTQSTLAKLEFAEGPLLGTGQSLCLYCHDEPVYRDPAGVLSAMAHRGAYMFDRCDACHEEQIPIDTSFYLHHITSRMQHARSALAMAQMCAVCHSDPKIRADFKMQDGVVHYTSTYHGKAALLGSEETADCVACHARGGENAHLIRSQTDPLSSSHPSHKAETCRSTNCHPGADKSLGAASVHLDFPSLTGMEILLAIAFVGFTLFTFGPSLVVTLLELFQMLLGRHYHGHAEERELTLTVLRTREGRRRLIRFTPAQRVQHWILVVLFVALAVTGFPMKFASQLWARPVIEWFGGLAVTRAVHHWAGIALVVGFFIHLLYCLGTLLKNARQPIEGQRRTGLIRAALSLPMFVGPRDLLKFGQLLGYLVFLRKEPPAFGRFSIDQKFEYLGVFWGTILLGVTGMLLWGEQISSRFIGGRVFNLAMIAHTYEAFLAVIHVGILHICHVAFTPNSFPFSRAMFTGETPVSALAEVHYNQVKEVAQDLGMAVPQEVSHE